MGHHLGRGHAVFPAPNLTQNCTNSGLCSNHGYFEAQLGASQRGFHRGARGRAALGQPGVPHRVHLGKLSHVADMNQRAQQVRFAAAHLCQQRVDAAQRLLRLFRHGDGV